MAVFVKVERGMGTNRDELVARYIWSSVSWLADHQLLGDAYWNDGAGARWEIGQPGTFVHRCEILAGISGALIVHGDFDVVRFARPRGASPRGDSVVCAQQMRVVAAGQIRRRRAPRVPPLGGPVRERLETAELFNARVPVGTPVRYYSVRGDDEHKRTRTRSEAWTLNEDYVLVKVEGVAGGVLIDHVRVDAERLFKEAALLGIEAAEENVHRAFAREREKRRD